MSSRCDKVGKSYLSTVSKTSGARLFEFLTRIETRPSRRSSNIEPHTPARQPLSNRGADFLSPR